MTIRLTYIVLRLVQQMGERTLAWLNRGYYQDKGRQAVARQTLGMSDEDMQKTLAYSEDKFRFGSWSGWISISGTLVFLAVGGFGWAEGLAKRGASSLGAGSVVTGLLFFAVLGLISMLFALPFDYYRQFVIEQKHGFNRQNVKGFVVDRLKGLVLGAVLGGLILAAILWIMEAAGDLWWIYAWIAMSSFSLLTAWIYPSLLAPLFNKFTPLTEGELKDKIEDLARKVGFQTNGVYIMDASTRSSHGNAYFTGVAGKKRIVLFDTLVQSMSASQVVAVLAHELGHFKLKHVRWALVRGIVMTGVIFYLLSLCLPFEQFYQAFYLDGISNYGALIVFGMWFGILEFALQPLSNYISRRNEFAADRFAREQAGDSQELGAALVKLRETSHAMPITHPIYSAVYYSHPPMLERLQALGYTSK